MLHRLLHDIHPALLALCFVACTSSSATRDADGGSLADMAMDSAVAPEPPDLMPVPLILSSVSPGVVVNSATSKLALRGRGFQTGARVLINGIEASGAVVNSSQDISVTALPRAGFCGLLRVEVVNPDGQSAGGDGLLHYVSATPLYYKSTVTLSANQSGVATGDLNGDGKPDLAVFGSSSTTLYLANGNGDGTFGTPTSMTLAAAPSQVKLGDINGDRRADIITLMSDQSSRYYYSQPAGTYSTGGGLSQSAATLLDTNGDGLLDVYSASTYYAGIASYPQIQIGTSLSNGTSYTYSSSLVSYSRSGPKILVADVNNDMRPDVLVQEGYYSGFGSTYYPGSGSIIALGTSTGGWTRNLILTHPGYDPVAFADFDGNGTADLLMSSNSKVQLHRGTGTGFFLQPESYSTPDTNNQVVGAVVGEYSNDGRTDVALLDRVTGKLAFLYGYYGDAALQVAGSATLIGGYPSAMASEDFDGDGRKDFVVVKGMSADIYLGQCQ